MAGHRGGSRDRALRQPRPELAACRADDPRCRGGQARRLREAARAGRRRELRDLATRGGDRRQAPVRVQLPLRPGRPARARADRRRRARRDPPLPRPLPAGLGRHGRAGVALRPRRRRVRGRSATWLRTSSTSRATSSARSTRSAASSRRSSRAARSTMPWRRRFVRERRRRDARGDAARARAAQRVPVGDQRHEGIARLRHGAPERAAGLQDRGDARTRLHERARLGGRAIRSGSTGGRRATSSAGATRSSTSSTTS